jgi:hypothetical protein
MKPFILLIFIAIGFTFSSCEKNNTDREFPFEAEVLGRNTDCGIFAIKFTNNLDQVHEIADSYVLNDVYIEKNLPAELQIEGLSIVLNIRKIQDSELGICTDMGPSYPWIYVLSAKKKE